MSALVTGCLQLPTKGAIFKTKKFPEAPGKELTEIRTKKGINGLFLERKIDLSPVKACWHIKIDR